MGEKSGRKSKEKTKKHTLRALYNLGKRCLNGTNTKHGRVLVLLVSHVVVEHQYMLMGSALLDLLFTVFGGTQHGHR